jgi:hypothetical protein
MSVVISTEKIEARDVEFSFDAAHSEFSAWIEEANVFARAKTLEECRRKARAMIRRALAKLELKAHIVNAYHDDFADLSWHQRKNAHANLVRPITIRGIDGRSGEPLFEYEDSGRKTKKSRHSFDGDAGVIVRRLTTGEVKEYRKLRDARDEAEGAFKLWIEEHEIKSVESWVKEKLEASIQDDGGDSEQSTGDPRVDAPASKRKTRRKP